jgi:hypothetical protein
MTVTEWLACEDPVRLLKSLGRGCCKRKRRLFGCACCRRVWHLIPDTRSRNAVLVAERFADGEASAIDLKEAKTRAKVAYDKSKGCGPPYHRHHSATACYCVAMKNAGDAIHAWHGSVAAVQVAGGDWHVERAALVHLLRDIFGNPFRPVTVEPGWLTSDVVALARSIYDERNFTATPILADALQDAGCENADVLSHCRDPQLTHVRGCWVVDLVLGKT